MLNEREIDIEIARLEFGESNYPDYAKLADLYIIKNQLHKGEAGDTREFEYSYASASEESVIGSYGDTEFLSAIEGKPTQAVWLIMDSLMDTLKIGNPKVYNRVMSNLDRV